MSFSHYDEMPQHLAQKVIDEFPRRHWSKRPAAEIVPIAGAYATARILRVSPAEAIRRGEEHDRLLDIDRMVEKPAPEDAPSRLGVAGRGITVEVLAASPQATTIAVCCGSTTSVRVRPPIFPGPSELHSARLASAPRCDAPTMAIERGGAVLTGSGGRVGRFLTRIPRK